MDEVFLVVGFFEERERRNWERVGLGQVSLDLGWEGWGWWHAYGMVGLGVWRTCHAFTIFETNS